MADDWEEIDVPRGAYISWAARPGQRVIGNLIDVEMHGGSDFNGDECPLLTIKLTEDAYSVDKHGERRNYSAGDMVLINCGLYNLKQAVKFANLKPGNGIRIHYHDITTVDKGEAKQFNVAVRRQGIAVNGAERQPATSGAPASRVQDDEPPF